MKRKELSATFMTMSKKVDPVRKALKRAPKASSATIARIRKELRYMSPKHVVEDYGTPRDRQVIAAVLRWFGLNSVVAWRRKDGTYDCVWNRGGKTKNLRKTDAIVMTEKKWREAMKVLRESIGVEAEKKRR